MSPEIRGVSFVLFMICAIWKRCFLARCKKAFLEFEVYGNKPLNAIKKSFEKNVCCSRLLHIFANIKGKRTHNINVTKAECCLQTMMLGKILMKIGPTVWKIQALKCFKITVMGAPILIL